MEPTPAMGSVLVQEDGREDQALEEDAGGGVANLTL
jgi:hypothetical protein